MPRSLSFKRALPVFDGYPGGTDLKKYYRSQKRLPGRRGIRGVPGLLLRPEGFGHKPYSAAGGGAAENRLNR